MPGARFLQRILSAHGRSTTSGWYIYELPINQVRRVRYRASITLERGRIANLLNGDTNEIGDDDDFFIQKAIGWALRDYRHR